MTWTIWTRVRPSAEERFCRRLRIAGDTIVSVLSTVAPSAMSVGVGSGVKHGLNLSPEAERPPAGKARRDVSGALRLRHRSESFQITVYAALDACLKILTKPRGRLARNMRGGKERR